MAEYIVGSTGAYVNLGALRENFNNLYSRYLIDVLTNRCGR